MIVGLLRLMNVERNKNKIEATNFIVAIQVFAKFSAIKVKVFEMITMQITKIEHVSNETNIIYTI